MDNCEIIARAAVSSGLYTPDEIYDLIEGGSEVPLHTVAGWNARIGNCHVRRGEHGIETRLWKRRKRQNQTDGAQADDTKSDFYLAKSYLFRRDQMERIAQ